MKYYNNPCLREKAVNINEINNDIKKTIDTMIDELVLLDGIGIAAQQIGSQYAIIVINNKYINEYNGYTIFANPQIIDKTGKIIDEERCLSFPGLCIQLARPEKITVVTQQIIDDKLSEPIIINAEKDFARLLCHEIDHLNGVLIIDYLTQKERAKILANWYKYRRQKHAGNK